MPKPAKDTRQATTPASGVTAHRVAELTDKRSESIKRYRMSDGSIEAELFTGPVHYRDNAGHWQSIDTKIGASGKPGYGFGNSKSGYKSDFGRRSDQLVDFELDGRSIAMGASGNGRQVAPVVAGNQITYPDVFGQADVRYRVGAKSLKEEIVLDEPPQSATYTFDLKAKGLEPRPEPDGSIGFYREGDSTARPAFVMPKPYMVDSADDPSSPYGKKWSSAVTQTVAPKGNGYQVTLTANVDWLNAPEREFPVVIDPTIEVVPDPSAAQDTMIYEGSPTSNYGSLWNVNVGNAAVGANSSRGLFKFDVAQLGIAPNTPIKAASLDVHFSQPHSSESVDVALEARKVTAVWTESNATWAGMNAAYDTSSLPFNYLQVNDELEEGRVQSTGPWQYVDGATNSINGGLHQLPTGSTADTFSWMPDIAGAGTFRVDAYYTAAANRGAPSYAVTDDTGTAKTYTVNQASGTAGTGVWSVLGYQHFSPGKSASITMTRVTANSSPVADALRFVQAGTQTKLARERDAWHSYAVGNIVSDWVNNPGNNFGLMLKASNEDAGIGGPSYEASEDLFEGETGNRPRLMIQYAEPSVDLATPTTIHPTGAELSWGDYVDPSAADGDDLVDFAIYRACVTLPGGACTNPVPEYPAPDFNATNPSGVDLIGTVPKDIRSFTDTSATATTAAGTASFRYWVVARTKDGTLSPSASQVVQTPLPGRVAKVLTGDISDSTIANATAYQGTNIPTADGYNWLMAGNNHATYGDTRALLAFDTGSIPTGATVLNSELQLWKSTAPGAGATFDLHELTRSFVEDQVNWNNATSTIPWTTKGGDFDTNPVASASSVNGQPTRMKWKSDLLTGVVQEWANVPAAGAGNHGLLIKAHDETTSQQRIGFASGELAEPALRPKLVVEYIDTTAAGMYYAHEIPDRVVPNTTLTVPVTITNTTKTAWTGQRLSYRWMADGVDQSDEGDRLYTAVNNLAPGESHTVDAQIRVPIQSPNGNKREEYVLELELRNLQNVWASDPASGIDIDPLRQPTIVEDPTSSELGLEKFFTYSGENTGAGSTLTPNLHAGNAVFSYSPIQNPSRGAATFVRLTYDSNDITSSAAGRGWSVQASTLTRLGRSALTFSSDNEPTTPYPRTVTMIDGDGTSHVYTFDSSDKDHPENWHYKRPAGVALELQLNTAPGTPADKAWSLTRPDGTRFFFEDTGNAGAIQRYIVDRNGNTTEFRYDAQAGDTRLLTSIVDPDQRTTLALTYEPGTSRLRRLADIDGRTLRFVYDTASDPKLIELRDGGDYNPVTDTYSGPVKIFKFGYDGDLRLSSVRDPLNGETKLTYWATPWAGRLKTLTDRRGKVTEFTYVDTGGIVDPAFETTVTGILVDGGGTHRFDTVYTTDAFGRTTRIMDANGKTAKLAWDRDNNVVRMEEANGAVSTWTYDAATGYPKSIKDAEANKNGTAATELKYLKLTAAPGTPTVLEEKKSPEGRKWQFTYDPVNGNLETVTDPLGVNSPAAGDYQTAYDYNGAGQLTQVHDANGNAPTVYTDYDFNGYPKTITDPLGKSTLFQYDLRGHVVSVKDALLKETTAEYDAFGRVTKQSVPQDTGAVPPVIQTTQTQYDLNDNVAKVIAPNGAETTATYNAADEQETSILPSNGAAGERKVTYTYDDLGRLLQQTAPQGNLTPTNPDDFVTRYTYDPIGQLVNTVTPFDGQSSYKTSYEYDSVGNLVLVLDPRKNDTADANDFTSRMTYDLNHRVVATTDAAGYTSRTVYDRDGLVVSEFDADGNKKATVYDARGKATQVSVPHTPTGGTTVQRTTKYYYDENGNPTATESPLGVSTASDPNDSIGRMTYDANNRVIEQIAPFKTGDSLPARTFYEYDAVGNVTRQSDPTNAATKADAQDWSTFTWFDNGLTRTSTDPWGISTSYGYNLLGQQTSRTLTSAAGGASRTMAWEFWPDGSLRTRNDAAPPAGLDEVLVDNSDGQNTVVTGTWATAKTASTKIGFDYRTHAGASGSTDTFAWKLRVPSAGTYEVFARCPQGAGTATAAVYSVQHSAGTASKTVNQSTCTAQSPWVSLGSYSYAEGVDKKVTLAVPATGTVVADAVKMVRAGSTPGAAKDFDYGYDVNGQLTSIADRTPDALVDTYEVRYDGLGRADQVRELKAGSARSTTSYGYDANSNLMSWFADDQVAPETDQFSGYTYDVRDLLESVKTGNSPTDPGLKTTAYTYTARGERAGVTKPNGNKVAYRWIEDGLLRSQVELQATNTISSHFLGYDLDGRRTSDVSKVQNADSPSAYLNQTATMAYKATGRLWTVQKSGANPGKYEGYAYDAAGNITWQVDGSTNIYFRYDRNRLQCAGSNSGDPCGVGSTAYNYDPFGRLDTVTSGDKTVERYGYDGFDRTTSHRKYDPVTGVSKSSQTSVFDPLDRTVSESTTVGTGTAKATTFGYVGLTDQVITEEQPDSGGTPKAVASYTYGPSGERISQTKNPLAGGASETSYYGLNPHTDVETLTGETGAARSTYRYSGYGRNDATGFTGKDKATATGGPEVEAYNPYRFNSKRWDPATAGYDMGFRDYSPGLNRFLTRDMYSGALADLKLGADPWNTNRYAFAGGNPITGIELDGHCAMADEGGCDTNTDYSGPVQPASTVPTESETATPSSGKKIAQWFGENPTQKVGEEVFIKPVEETVEACKAAVQMENFATSWQQCKTGAALTALGFTGSGRLVGVGVRTAEGLAAAEAEGAWAGVLTGHTVANAKSVPRFISTSSGVTIDRMAVNATVSTQRQGRHVLGARQYAGGSYFNSADDAQRVLDDFHSGAAEVLGVKGNDIVVRVHSVTGFNHNPGAGFPNQPTNVFFIKGSSSPSVVPYNPGWTP